VSVRRVRAQAGMELRLLLRNGENLLVTIAIPLGLLLFFSTVDVLDVGQEPVDFLYPGMLAVAVMSTGMVSLAIATGFERSYGVLKRLGATPLRRTELIAAKVAAVLVIEILQVGALTALALLLGWRPVPGVAGPAVAVLAVLLGTAAFVGVGMAMAGRLRAIGTLALTNAVFVALLLVSGVVFPLASLPGPAVAVARLLPTTALADVLRAALGGSGPAAAALLVLAVWAVVAPAVAAAGFTWEEPVRPPGRTGPRRRPSRRTAAPDR
jgi:ABC-2 type transport system permease protein